MRLYTYSVKGSFPRPSKKSTILTPSNAPMGRVDANLHLKENFSISSVSAGFWMQSWALGSVLGHPSEAQKKNCPWGQIPGAERIRTLLGLSWKKNQRMGANWGQTGPHPMPTPIFQAVDPHKIGANAA